MTIIEKPDRSDGAYTTAAEFCASGNTGTVSRNRIAALLIAIALGIAGNPGGARANRFHHYSMEQGLSENSINCLLEDRNGFLWIGTNDGLNRFDGYQFLHFQYDPMDEHSLSDNYVTALCEDDSGNIWVGTRGGGLSVYCSSTQCYRRYRHDPGDSASLNHDRVNALAVDSGGMIWIGTQAGLSCLNPAEGRFVTDFPGSEPESIRHAVLSLHIDSYSQLWAGTSRGLYCRRPDGSLTRFEHHERTPSSISPGSIYSITAGPDSMLWLGIYGSGLNLFDCRTERAERFLPEPGDPNRISHSQILSVTSDGRGGVWAGLFGGGLFHLRLPEKSGTRYKHHPALKNGISGDYVRCVYRDHAGLIWAGTWGTGLNCLAPSTPGIHSVSYEPERTRWLSDNRIQAFAEDETGNIWIGIYGGGLNYWNLTEGTFRTVSHRSNDRRTPSSDQIYSLLRAGDKLWIGTWGYGLDCMDLKTGMVQNFRYRSGEEDGLAGNSIVALLEDMNRHLWIGISGGGLNRMDPSTGRFYHYRHMPGDSSGLSHNDVQCLLEDSRGRIWAGTWGGGLNMKPQTEEGFIYFTNSSPSQKRLSSDNVTCLYEDREGDIWVGTRGGGLHRIQGDSLICRPVGIPGSHSMLIHGILGDDSGNIWFSTPGGITKLNPAAGVLWQLNTQDGLPGEDFISRSVFKTQDGRFLFGAISGFTHFYPDSVKPQPPPSRLVFTELRIGNDLVAVNEPVYGRVLLQKPVNDLDAIRMTHREKVFSVGFSALALGAMHRVSYAYKLEGFDEDWIETGRNRYATFTNLSHGKYTLRVRAFKNNDSRWDQEASLQIFMKPRFRDTTVFRLILIAAGILLFAAVYQMRIVRFRRANEELSRRVRERTGEIRQAYWELQQEVLQRKKAEKEAGRRAAQSALVYSTGQHLSRYLDLQDLLKEIVHSICQAFQYHVVTLFLVDDSGKRLRKKAAAGAYAKALPDNLSFSVDEGIVGYAFRNRQIRLVNDTRLDPDYIQKITENTLSELAVPLIREYRILGVLDLQSDKLNDFDDSDVLLMETLSTQIVTAIENASLFEQLQKELAKRKKTQEALRQSEKKYRDLYSRIVDPVFILDAETLRFIDGNPAVRDVLQYGMDELSGMLFSDLAFMDDPSGKTDWEKVFRSDSFLCTMIRRDSRKLVMEIRTAGVRFLGKRARLCIGRDITAHKELQTQLTDFAYIVSHDLRAPLRAVSQLSKWLYEDYRQKLDKEGKHCLDLMQQRVRRMDHLISGILHYSRANRTAGSLEVLDLHTLAEEVIRILNPPAGIRFHIRRPLPKIPADRVRMEQVFQNLLGNAVKFMDKPEGMVRIFSKKDGGYYSIHIKDNGPGIDPRYHKKIFQIFQTLDSRDVRESTGVGLSIVKKIVEGNGGVVWVKSQPGKGAEFIFTIPERGWQSRDPEHQTSKHESAIRGGGP